jgi:pyridoxal phosphate enzyme (YggS family)
VSIHEGLAAVRARIAAACARAGRSVDEVTLVAVTKTFPASYAEEAIAAGVTDIGENRVQEAREKKPLVFSGAQAPSPASPVRWHLIGHLQSNKAKDAIELFDVIQSVDSLALAEKIARAADNQRKRQDVLLQVNIGDETQKGGVPKAEAAALARAVADLPSLRLLGLMAIPPVGTADESRSYFRELRALRDELGVEHLSMGMTEDFEIAIEEGATIVRVGRAIFGSRG